MRIVSMCTHSYNKWFPSFYYSIRKENPSIPITVYLLNYPEEQHSFLKEMFRDVNFITQRGLYALREHCNPAQDRYKVTYLKGKMIKEASEIYKEDVLWIDITSLIRTNLDDVAEMLRQKDAIVIRRERDIKTHNKHYAYCAEIFGISSRNQSVIDHYQRCCENRKDSWFADQVSLCELPTQKKGYLEFGTFCNFYYDQKARSWSDRGKTGIGIVTQDDAEYTLGVYGRELNKYYRGYQKKYLKFIKQCRQYVQL